MKRAPKKLLLKPFPEEQRPPVGHTPSSERLKVTDGGGVFTTTARGEASGDCCSSRQTWTEGNNATAVLFTICTFSWNTDKKFCRRRRNKRTKWNKIQKQMKETKIYKNDIGEEREVFFLFFFNETWLCWSGVDHRYGLGRGTVGKAEASF